MYWESIDYDKSGTRPLDGGRYLVATPKGLLEARWTAKHPVLGARDLVEGDLPDECLSQTAPFWLGREREAYARFDVHHWCPLPGSREGLKLALSEPDLRRESLAIEASPRKDRTTTLIQTRKGWIEAIYSRQAEGWISPGGRVFHRKQIQTGTVFPLPTEGLPSAVLVPGSVPLWG